MSRSGRFTHRVDRYAEAVLDKAIVAGPYVRLACERHFRDRERAEGGGWFQFSTAFADQILDFYEGVLRLPDLVDDLGDPQPFRLDVGTGFWAFVLGSGFGWVDKQRLRRFREWFIETGKGSAKTPVLAGVGLYGLTSDGERAAEIYAAAADQDQAGIMFRDAVRIAKASPDLDEVLEYDGGSHIWQIRHPESLSFFRTFSRESGQKSGTRPHMGLLDELHEHPSHETSVKVRAGAKRRPQPLFAEITNSGFDRTSICWQRHEHSRRVLERTIEDDRLFSYVCSLDEGDEPMVDESCWPKTNPYLGVTVTEDYLRRQVENARNIPAEMNGVLRLNFCVWTQSNERFFDAAKWQAGATMPSDAELAGATCYAGIDAGQSDDISAFARIWLLDDGRVVVKMRYWLPRAALEKYPERPYAQWEASGLLTVTDGDVVDYEVIEQTVEDLCRESGVIQCGFDKRFLGQMAQRLVGAGLSMVDIPQGFHLNEAIKLVSEWVAGEKLCHGGDPILAWMADNAVVKFGRNKEMRLDKEASRDKIDGVVALVIAARLVTLQAPEEKSIYETRGLATL